MFFVVDGGRSVIVIASVLGSIVALSVFISIVTVWKYRQAKVFTNLITKCGL